jgi:tetratricopeptide (TPR) repeat protein
MEGPIQSFNLAFDEICSALPGILEKTATEEQAVNAPFSPVKPDPAHVLHDIELEIATLRQRCRKGLTLILQELHSRQDATTRERTRRLEVELTKAFDSVHSAPTFTQIILKVVSGETWREALRLPRDIIDLLYLGAKALFENGQYSEAMDSFAFLAWFDARQYEFWMALGHAQFHTAHYNAAISSYGIALQCLPEESWPDVYSAACFEALGDFEQASRCILAALNQEKKKAEPDHGLIMALDEKLNKYRQRSATPIS